MYPKGTNGLSKIVLGPDHYIIGEIVKHRGKDVVDVHDIVAGGASEHALVGKPNVHHVPVEKLVKRGATFHAYHGTVPAVQKPHAAGTHAHAHAR